MKGIERQPDGTVSVDLLQVDAGKPNWLSAKGQRLAKGGWPAFKKRKEAARRAAAARKSGE